jgi:hypothetical protein
LYNTKIGFTLYVSQGKFGLILQNTCLAPALATSKALLPGVDKIPKPTLIAPKTQK